MSPLERSEYCEFCEKHHIYPKERTDPALVSVIEEMGEEATQYFAPLKVVEIPDGVEWEIMSEENTEWVAEKHRTWR